MKVLFSHGKESGPWGLKIKRLATIAEANHHSVESIDYSDTLDPDLRVERLLNVLKNESDFILVGSSMGGYVSLVASQYVEAKGLFLLAPALFMPGYQHQSYNAKCPIEIVHGWSDNVIPPANSIRFAQEYGSPLHLIDGDHRLNSSIDRVGKLFCFFLESLAPTEPS
jgi:pimeloyl-ACP methyl ester carboxylesterase